MCMHLHVAFSRQFILDTEEEDLDQDDFDALSDENNNSFAQKNESKLNLKAIRELIQQRKNK